MSLLTKYEKSIIKRLRNSSNGRDFVLNVIDNEIEDASILIDRKNKKAFILVDKTNYTNLPDIKRIYLIIYRTMKNISISFGLIDYLNQCGLVTLHNQESSDEIITIGPGISDDNAQMFEIKNTTVIEYLIKYNDRIIEIKEDVKNL